MMKTTLRRIGIQIFLVTLSLVLPLSPAAAQATIITADNASHLKQTDMIGSGGVADPTEFPHALTWLPDSKTFAVETSIGLWLYPVASLSQSPRLLNQIDGMSVVSADGKWAVGLNYDIATSDFRTVVTDVATGQEVFHVENDTYVEGIAISPDSTTLVIYYGRDNALRFYAIPTGKMLANVTVKDVGEITYAPDGSLVATGTYGLQFFDGKSGLLRSTVTGKYPPRDMTISSDAQYFFGKGSTGLVIWSKRGLLTSITMGSSAQSFATTADGSLLAAPSGQFPNDILVRNVKTGASHFLKGHTDAVIRVAFSPDKTSLLSISADGTARLWDVATGQSHLSLATDGHNLLDAVYSPDGKWIAGWDDAGQVRVWDAATGEANATWGGHFEQFTAMALSPDGQTIAVGAVKPSVRWLYNQDSNVINLYDTSTDKQLSELVGHRDFIQSLAYSPDGSLLASSDLGSAVRVWDARADKPLDIYKGATIGEFSLVAFSPDSKTLATNGYGDTPISQGSFNQVVGLWDIATSKQQAKLDGGLDGIHALTFSPDGKTLAVGYGEPGCAWGNQASPNADAAIRLWDMATSKVTLQLTGHKYSVNGLAYSLDGSTLASAGRDGTVRLWDVKTGKPQRILVMPADQCTATFSPDGKLLVTAGEDGIRVWNLAIGQQLIHLGGDTAAVVNAVFSPDGTKLISISWDGTIRFWAVDADS